MKKNFILFATACLAGPATLFAQDTIPQLTIDSTLTVGDSAIFNRNIRIEGETDMRENARAGRDLTVDGDTYLNGNMTTLESIFYPNAQTVSAEISDLDLLFIDRESGQIEKSGVNSMVNHMYSLQCNTVGGIVANPVWNNGPNKIYTPCPEIKVGIGTINPTHGLHVVNDVLFQSTLQTNGNVGIGVVPSSFSRVTIRSESAGAGLEINNTGNDNPFSKLLFLRYDDPTTEIIKVVNTTANEVPFLLRANGSMIIRNNERETFNLDAEGILRARTVILNDSTNWPDYVFTPSYNLRPLSEVKSFISTNGHLPEVPSASQIESEGINVAEMNVVLLKKLEELTLYILEQEERIKELEAVKH